MPEGQIIDCVHCQGSGICQSFGEWLDGKPVGCPLCLKRAGISPVPSYKSDGGQIKTDWSIVQTYIICSVCNGKGKVWVGPLNT